MSESADQESDSKATAQQLGESFASVMGGREWQVDEIPEAVPVEADDQSGESIASEPPPLAEPVNETAVPPSPLQIIEALLFVGGPPLTAEHAAEAIRGLRPEQFREYIDGLNRVYRDQNRPYSIVHGQTGYVMRINRRFAGVREKLYGGPREARLTQQALDVLSLVAYRQPVGKAEVDGARGLDSGSILRQLVRLGLVATNQENDLKTVVYTTTPRFLEVFRIRDLDDLPHIGEPQRLG